MPTIKLGQISLLFVLMSAISPASALAANLQGYWSTRDRFVRLFTSISVDDPRTGPKHDRALRSLGEHLKTLIGPVAVEGFPREGTTNLVSLIPGDQGYGMLDGLTFQPRGGSSRLVVTTGLLLQRWLREHQEAEAAEPIPSTVPEALTSEAFYTQAVGLDAAIVRFATIPIAVPPGTIASAMLVRAQQDIGSGAPNEMIVSVVRNGRVFIAIEPAKAAPIPACEAVWEHFQARASRILAAYQASRFKDEARFGEYEHLNSEGDAHFRRCYNDRAREQAFFPALARKAQSLLDRITAR
jgi:hypothetical protein